MEHARGERPTTELRIVGGLLAYVAGDAAGAPWEGSPPSEIDSARIGAPPGPTTDDTAFTWVMAEHIAAEHEPSPARFMERLAPVVERTPGTGPTTRAAVGRYRRDGSVVSDRGGTNGAAMRSLPIGWAFPLAAADDRRAWVIELSRTTHGEPDAAIAAGVMAMCASATLEIVASPLALRNAAEEEAGLLARMLGARGMSDVPALVRAVRHRAWRPPARGVSLDAAETVAAVLHVLSDNGPQADIEAAIRLGGDTDTVAALAGGIAGALRPAEARGIPWLESVDTPADPDAELLAGSLARRRELG